MDNNIKRLTTRINNITDVIKNRLIILCSFLLLIIIGYIFYIVSLIGIVKTVSIVLISIVGFMLLIVISLALFALLIEPLVRRRYNMILHRMKIRKELKSGEKNRGGN